MRRVAPVVAALLLGLCTSSFGAGKWTRIRTDDLVFVGDASERDIRQVAQTLDRFRDALARVLPKAPPRGAVPTIVVVFRNSSSFTPYKPRVRGRAVELGGFFAPGRDVNYIAINAEAAERAFHAIFHDYTHVLVESTVGTVPLWLDEGLAELYATFQEPNGGKSAMLGLANPDHVARLRRGAPMPLRDLMALDRSSADYDEDSRRGVFYAESWALAHYLTLGSEVRAAQLKSYLARLGAGEAPEDSFRQAVGDVAALDGELKDYIVKNSFPAIRLDFNETLSAGATARSAPIDEAEAGGYLGDLLAHIDQVDDARTGLQKTVAANPQAPRASYALGLLELRAQNLNAALPLLERAVAIDPTDATYQTALGQALLAKWNSARGDPRAADTLKRARAALSDAVDLDPRAADALVTLARAEMESHTDADLADATSLLERAVLAAPAREEYRLTLAESLVEQRDFDTATRYLGPLMARSSRQDIRDAARRLLATIAARSESRKDSAARDAERHAAADPDVPPDSPSIVVSLRKVGDGETRVLGWFDAIECSPKGIIFRISSEDRPLRFSAAKLDEVEFITYRSQTPGTVACGAVNPPVRVLATYRRLAGSESAGSAVAGRLVAIELLPDGFTPKNFD